MYDIYTSKYKDVKLQVHIDGKQPTAIPPWVLAGGRGWEKRYTDYLEKHAFKDKDLLNFLVFVHKEAKKDGKLALVFKRIKGRENHANILKEFILKHRDTFDAMIPYLFPGAVVESQKEPQEIDNLPPELKDKLVSNMPTGSEFILSKEDMDKIHELIRTDQGKLSVELNQAMMEDIQKKMNDIEYTNNNNVTDVEIIEESTKT